VLAFDLVPLAVVATAPEPWAAQQPPAARRLPRDGQPELTIIALVQKFAADPDSFDGNRLLWDVTRRAPSHPEFMDTVVSAADRPTPADGSPPGCSCGERSARAAPRGEWTMAVGAYWNECVFLASDQGREVASCWVLLCGLVRLRTSIPAALVLMAVSSMAGGQERAPRNPPEPFRVFAYTIESTEAESKARLEEALPMVRERVKRRRR